MYTFEEKSCFSRIFEENRKALRKTRDRSFKGKSDKDRAVVDVQNTPTYTYVGIIFLY